MAVYSGKFIDGKVVVDGDAPPDGTEVEVDITEAHGEVWLTPAMEADLEAAIQRMERGEFVTWDVLRERLRVIERGGRHAQD